MKSTISNVLNLLLPSSVHTNRLHIVQLNFNNVKYQYQTIERKQIVLVLISRLSAYNVAHNTNISKPLIKCLLLPTP